MSVCVVGHSGGSSGSGSLLHSGVQSGGFKHSDSPVLQWPADIWCESGQQAALPGGGAERRDRKVQPGGEGHCMCFNAGQWLRSLHVKFCFSSQIWLSWIYNLLLQISLHYNIPTPADVTTLSVEVKPVMSCVSQRPKLTLELTSL